MGNGVNPVLIKDYFREVHRLDQAGTRHVLYLTKTFPNSKWSYYDVHTKRMTS